ncbi:hypothetical protein NDN08_001510 [Rhodosorus marinus]|uniref:Dolichyl-diphosphooligosaccharide--protein glycosyltransferase 48 kDa subunit n=1 Tax=Rhodosorus marinus TaxID=101924 RepID=A0AAV8UR63_9RHOD|nr:hypothetical protein NDN08_001510 [Rhodosorus marinus]
MDWRKRSIFALLLLIFWVGSVEVEGELGGRRVLMIIDDLSNQENYSTILKYLQEDGFQVTVKEETEDTLVMYDGVSFMYDSIILLAPKARSLGRGMPIEGLDDFLMQGNSILLGMDPVYSDFMKKIALSFGVELDRKRSYVIDHGSFHKDLDKGDHTAVISGGHSISSPLTDGAELSGISFRGVGAALVEDNELVEKLLWGSETSFSYKPSDDVVTPPLVTGTDCVLAAAVQTRKQSRAVYAGSIEMFQNEMMDSAGGDHRRFVLSLLTWTLGSKGLLRADKIRWHRVGEEDQKATYRVKDDLVVKVNIMEWYYKQQQWEPFASDDVQIEFTSMDPYARVRLVPQGNGSFEADVPVPDHYGVFKLEINHFRQGYTPISMYETMSIRPFWHNEYPRFILRAYPYYLSAVLNLVGVFVFAVAYLYSKEPKAKAVKAAASKTVKAE